MSSIKVTWLGHSAFRVDAAGRQFLIDPFLTDNPSASCSADSLKPDVILVTHGHSDHVGDTVRLATRTGALVISNFEICEWLSAHGVKNVHGMNHGGRREFEFGSVLLTVAHHSSQLPDGSYGGNPGGIVLKLPGGTIYHAGDTALFSDMALIGEEGLDLAILPIGDNYTMGPQAAVRAVKFLNPKLVLPCHYNTWPVIGQDPQAWANAVRRETSAEPVVLEPGTALTLNANS